MAFPEIDLEVERTSKKVELAAELQYTIKQYAHRKWLSSQPFSRTLWPDPSRPDFTRDLATLDIENKPSKLQGHPWMAPYEVLEKFATPKIVDGNKVFNDVDDLNSKIPILIEDMVDYAVSNPEELGFDPDLPAEEIASEMRQEMLDTIAAVGHKGIGNWRENIWEKGLPSNQNWVYVAEALLTNIDGGKGDLNPYLLTEEHKFKLIQIQGKLNQISNFKNTHEISEFLGNAENHDVLQVMVLAHDGWRERYQSQPFPDFSEYTNIEIKKYLGQFNDSLTQIHANGATDATEYYLRIQDQIAATRNLAQIQPDVSSQATFKLMFDIVDSLEKWLSNPDASPMFVEAVSRAIADMIYNIKADANPGVVEAILAAQQEQNT